MPATALIDAKEAAKKASEYFKELFPNACNLLLEEVELVDQRTTWLITLSYDALTPKSHLSMKTIFDPSDREYKQFRVNRESGEVEAMTIKVIR